MTATAQQSPAIHVRSLGLSERQQALRASGLGASELPVALGLSPFQSAAELAAVKRGELPPFEGNEFTHWGQRLERTIADEWLERHRAEGVSIFTPGTIRHPRSQILMASPDRVIVPTGRRAREVWKGLLEIKAVSAYRAAEFGEEADAIPEAYLVQTQVQMEVCDLDQAVLVPLIGGNAYREYPQARDREMGGQLVEFAEKWWADHVVQGLPCEPDGSEAYASFLRRRYPSDLAPALPITPEAAELVAKVREAKDVLAQAEEAEAAAVAALKALIGEHAGIEGACTWRNNKPSQKVDFDAAFEGFLIRLEENPLSGGFSIPRAKTRALWEEVLRDFTITKPGARVLRFPRGK